MATKTKENIKTFSISNFVSKVEAGKVGFLKPNLFLVEVTKPALGGTQNNRAVHDKIMFLCAGASTPGRQILTNPEKPFGQGQTYKIPYDTEVADISFRFYVDGRAEVIRFFDEWMRGVVALVPDESAADQGMFTNQVSYYDQYASEVKIHMYNESAKNQIVTYTLTGAYPIGMNEIALDWSNNGEVASLMVNFTFRAYSVQVFDFQQIGIAGADKVKGKKSDPFAAINAFAESLRDGAVLINSKIVSAEEKAKNAIMNNALVSGALNLIDAAHSVRNALDRLKTLDDALKGGVQARIPRFPKFGI